MKITIVGDSHGNTDWLLNVIDQSTDCIVQLGDFGYWGESKQAQRYLNDISSALVNQNKSLYFVDGNHENFDSLDQVDKYNRRTAEGFVEVKPNLYHVTRGLDWNWYGKTFAAMGGARSIDQKYRTPGVSWWIQEQITFEQMQSIADKKPVDYLFTHDAPSCIPMQLGDYLESTMHRAQLDKVGAIFQPKMWFHGHYHRYLEYEFRHRNSYSQVVGLDCDGMPNSWLILDTDDNSFVLMPSLAL